jgi:hypothetical protein
MWLALHIRERKLLIIHVHIKNMAGHIGIVACSAEGAALCYRTICVEGAAVMGTHSHPEITMHTTGGWQVG